MSFEQNVCSLDLLAGAFEPFDDVLTNFMFALGQIYILGAKPGDHAHLFNAVMDAGGASKLHQLTTTHLDKKDSTSQTQWATAMPLGCQPQRLANQLRRPAAVQSSRRRNQAIYLPVTASVVGCLVRAGRSCLLFQAVPAKVKNRRSLWERMQSAVLAFVFRSFRELLESLLTGRCRNQSLPSPLRIRSPGSRSAQTFRCQLRVQFALIGGPRQRQSAPIRKRDRRDGSK